MSIQLPNLGYSFETIVWLYVNPIEELQYVLEAPIYIILFMIDSYSIMDCLEKQVSTSHSV